LYEEGEESLVQSSTAHSERRDRGRLVPQAKEPGIARIECAGQALVFQELVGWFQKTQRRRVVGGVRKMTRRRVEVSPGVLEDGCDKTKVNAEMGVMVI